MKVTSMGAITFVNLCPHDVTLTDGNGMRMTFKASGQVARLESDVDRTSMTIELKEGIEVSLPIQKVVDGSIYGLPEPKENTMYITSYLIAKHAKREDIISPLTDATAIRDEDNKVIGVRGFQTFR